VIYTESASPDCINALSVGAIKPDAADLLLLICPNASRVLRPSSVAHYYV